MRPLVRLRARLLRSGRAGRARPVQALADWARRLAAGERVEPPAASGDPAVEALADHLSGLAAQIDGYRAGLRRYARALRDSQEEERRRIARELHDDTLQGLLAVARRLELHLGGEADPMPRARLEELQRMVSETADGVRLISRDLRPLILEDLGLEPALRMLVAAAREGEGAVPHADLRVEGEAGRLEPSVELALFRIAQEALANIRRHAHATGLEVRLRVEPAAVTLDVHDDGVGFETPAALAGLAASGHFGLVGMQERAWAAGGTLEVTTAPGHGCRLRAHIPLAATG